MLNGTMGQIIGFTGAMVVLIGVLVTIATGAKKTFFPIYKEIQIEARSNIMAGNYKLTVDDAMKVFSLEKDDGIAGSDLKVFSIGFIEGMRTYCLSPFKEDTTPKEIFDLFWDDLKRNRRVVDEKYRELSYVVAMVLWGKGVGFKCEDV